MKITRTLLTLIITLMLTVGLTGCITDYSTPIQNANAETNLKSIHNEYFDVEVVEDLGGGNLIVVDKNTNVLYLFVKGHYAATMTPIYNADGTVKLYEE